MKDAVGKRSHDSQPQRLVAAHHNHIVAKLLVQDVGDRIGVADDGDDVAAELAIQQQPWIRAFRCRRRQRGLEGEPVRFDKVTAHAEDARVARLVQVQTARVVAGKNAKRFDFDRIAIGDSQSLAAIAAVGIRGQRQQQVDEQLIAARARVPIGCCHGLAPERADRNDDECG